MYKVENLALKIGQRILLQDLSFDVNRGSFTALLGENGCGKSTLVGAIGGTHRTFSGEIRFLDSPIQTYSAQALALRRAVVNQFNQVNFAFRAEDILLMARHHYNEKKQDAYQLVEYLCSELDILHLIGHNVQYLSGGERQRVFIAKALLQLLTNINELRSGVGFKDKVLILDEPTSALDIRHQRSVLDLIKQLAEQGLTVICVTHDLNLISRFADQLILLGNGSMVAKGSPGGVLTEHNIEAAFGYRPDIIRAPSGHPYISY